MRNRRNHKLDGWGLYISLALAIGAALMTRSASRALAPDPAQVVLAKEDPELVLMRALVAEAGYSPRPDHPAILHVLRKRGGESVRAQARMAVEYCSVFKPGNERQHKMKARSADRRYLRAAAPDVMRLVRAWVLGAEIPDPCEGRAVHWGSRNDMEAREIDPEVFLDCGGTANVFISEWRQL